MDTIKYNGWIRPAEKWTEDDIWGEMLGEIGGAANMPYTLDDYTSCEIEIEDENEHLLYIHASVNEIREIANGGGPSYIQDIAISRMGTKPLVNAAKRLAKKIADYDAKNKRAKKYWQ